jgi:transcriptional regulator with GAF, ATPase, and Fis domain
MQLPNSGAGMATTDEDDVFATEYLDFAEMTRDDLQAKLFELLTLVETSRELLRARDPEDVARRVLLSAIGVLGASSACVLLRREEGFRLINHLGLDGEPDLTLPADPDLDEALRREPGAGPFRVDEPMTGALAGAFLHAYGESIGLLEADVICPLAGRRGLLGFLVLGRRLLTEGYTARDLDLFSSLAELYVLGLERAAHVLLPDSPPSPSIAQRSEGDHPGLGELRRRYPPLRKILGESEAMLGLFRDLVEFADSRATILIQGESGTGKELIARAIHELSRRREAPMEIVDCSSIPRELIESELFGHVRGAFTGAVRDRRGAFDLAHRGTIFLDEIGDMTLPSQTRLLRVLQEGKFRPVGGEKTHSVDVRVVAATNVDLREAVREGRFRKDLFFRIQVFPVWLPPLRDRVGDVEVLTRAFLKRFYADDGLDPPAIDPAVLERLSTWSFPGNVRELQNIAEALAIRSRTERRVTPAHLAEVFRSMNIDSLRAPAGAPLSPRHSPADPADPLTTDDPARSTGAFVCQAWQDAGFNLLEASRRLRARRIEGQRVPLVDRAQMSHYVDGEVLRAYLEAGSVEGAIERLGGRHPHRHRARSRVRRVLAQAAAAFAEGRAVEAFPRLPDEYRDIVRRLADAGAPAIERSLQTEED